MVLTAHGVPPARQEDSFGGAGAHVRGDHSTQALLAPITGAAGVLTPLQTRQIAHSRHQSPHYRVYKTAPHYRYIQITFHIRQST